MTDTKTTTSQVKSLPDNFTQLPLKEQEYLLVEYRKFLFEIIAKCTGKLQEIRGKLDQQTPTT